VESTDGYRRQCTEQIAQGKPLTAANHLSMLVFRLCEEWFCVPTAVLKEIVGIRPVHSVPHRRNGVLIGLANVRGELLPCFSLQHVLGMDGAVGSVSKTSDEDGPARGRLLVLLREGSRAVCPVSEVHGIVHFDPQTVMPASSTITRAASAYTRSVLTWQQHLVGVLSDELLFRSFNRSLA
jgi:chemotaxis-related protein WspD